MSRRRQALLALLPLALAVGLVAWLLRSSEAPEVGAGALAVEDRAAVAPESGRLAGARDPRAGAPVVRGRGCAIEVEVTRRGKPEAGRLSLYERSTRAASLPSSFAVGPAEWLLPLEGVHDADPAATAVADGAGRGVFAGLLPGTYDVAVTTADGRGASATVWLEADGQRSRVRLDVRAGDLVLRGRAHHADGRPFAGFVGAVGEHDGGPPLGSRPVEVGPDGRFELTGLDPGVLRVVAWMPGRFAVRTLSLVLPRAGELVIVVDRGMSERGGRVVADRDGRPVANAVVVASCGDGAAGLEYVEARAVTDGEGRFRLLVPEAPVQLSARAAGYVNHSGTRWLAPDVAVEVRLLRPGTVRGRVLAVADGAPVEGVPVFVVPHGDGTGSATVSGPDGRYEATGVEPTESTVFACGGGWVSQGFQTARPGGYDPLAALPVSEATILVDLHVVPAVALRGKVVDAGGAAVPGAVVTAHPKLPGDRDLPLYEAGPDEMGVATEADGGFAIANLPTGVTVRLDARAPDGATGKAGPFRLEGAEPEPVVIRLAAPRFAEVTVVDGSGVALAGVGLDVYQSTGRDGWTWLVDGHTGADGVARLGPLPPGEVEIDAWCDAFSSPDVLAGGPEGSTETVRATLTMTRMRRVAGIVRWSDGSPAVDVPVRITEGTDSKSSTETGASGQFVFEGVETAEVELRVRRDDDDEEPVVLKGVATDREDLEITLKGVAPPRLSLVVLDPEGRPVPVATVQINGNEHRVENGKLRLPVPEEECWGYVRLPRSETGRPLPFASQAFGPVPVGAQVYEVRLAPGSTIDGTVVDPAGRGVRGVRVRAVAMDVEHLSDHQLMVSVAATDAEGRFHLPSIGPGQYQIAVDAPPSYAPAAPVEAPAGARDLRIVLLEGLSQLLAVSDADGRPVARALVTAKPEGGATLYAETDRDGRARLEGLQAESTYELRVTPPFERADLLPHRGEGWKPSNDTIRLPRAHAVDGYVRDADGRFVAGADVFLEDARGRDHHERSDRLGHFEFERLPEGPVELLVKQETPARVGRKTKALAGARGLVLVLDGIASIRLRLESPVPVAFDPDDAPDLIDEETGERTEDAVVLDDGGHEVSGVHPKAAYTLYYVVTPEGQNTSYVAFRTGLRAGEGTVVVTLEPTLAIDGRLVGDPDLVGARVTATRGAVRRSASVGRDGRIWIPHLAPGPWTISATNRDKTLSGEVEADAGTTVEVRLRPVR